MATVPERVAAVVAPVVERLGLDLYDIEHTGPAIRVLVDREGGIDLGAVTDATRAISRALDEADPIDAAYTLEVSSPGLERPLRTVEHFSAASTRDERIRIKTKPGVEGERRFEGSLAEVDGDGITVRLDDGSTRALRYDDIDRARTVFAWGPAPRPGRPKEAHR